MDFVRGDGQLLLDIDLDPSNVHKEVLQNADIILDRIRKSIPLVRGLGIPGEYLGRPLNVVENEIIAEIYDQFDQYEPRAIIGGIRIESNYMTGQLIPIVEIEGVKTEDE